MAFYTRPKKPGGAVAARAAETPVAEVRMSTIEVIIPSRRSALVPRILSMLAKQDRRPDMVSVVSNVMILGPWGDLSWRRLGFTSDAYAIGGVGYGDVSLRRNVGLYTSTADVVFFMDDDELPPVGMVGDMLRSVDRERAAIWGNCRYLDVNAFSDEELLRSDASLGVARNIPNRRHGFECCAAGCLGVPRADALAVGGFDLAYTQGHEDQHFGLKLFERTGHARPWECTAVVSEPPFAWHRTDRVPVEPEPKENTCPEGKHVWKQEATHNRCTRCPVVFVHPAETFKTHHVLDYDPARVHVTLEQQHP